MSQIPEILTGNGAFGASVPEKPHVLVVPLDWGLGHATRCIPLIRALLDMDFRVSLAAETALAALLREEFPGLPILPLKGYRVQLARKRPATGILRQLPRLFRTVRQENTWLKTAIPEFKIDAVISDNRYGLYHPSVPCIFITHQLSIRTGLGRWVDEIVGRLNYRYINRFSACWVPDEAGAVNVAGALSHPATPPDRPVFYIGILSRLNQSRIPPVPNHLLISLSGPEPQRTELEDKIIEELSHYNYTATLVRGIPATDKLLPSTNSLKFYNHLPAAEMELEMAKASLVISRSGYTTLMDLATLQKRSVLIPTPGQAEQEYLAQHMREIKFAPSIKQVDFSLTAALNLAGSFDYSGITGSLPARPLQQPEKLDRVLSQPIQSIDVSPAFQKALDDLLERIRKPA